MTHINLRKILLINQIIFLISFIDPIFFNFEKIFSSLMLVFFFSIVFFWKKLNSLAFWIAVFLCMGILLSLSTALSNSDLDHLIEKSISNFDYYSAYGIIMLTYYLGQYLIFFPLLSITLIAMDYFFNKNGTVNLIYFSIISFLFTLIIIIQTIYLYFFSTFELGIYIIYILQTLFTIIVFLFYFKNRHNLYRPLE